MNISHKIKALAEYIQCIAHLQHTTKRAEDRNKYTALLAAAAEIFAKIELDVPVEQNIKEYERTLGTIWIE